MRRFERFVSGVGALVASSVMAVSPAVADDGDIQFGPAVRLHGGLLPWFVESGDLNGDARPDVIVGNAGGAGAMGARVFVNRTRAGATRAVFSGGQRITTGLSPQSLAVADFDADGKPDLAVGNFMTSNLLPIGAGIYVYANHTETGADHVQLERRAKVGAGTGPEVITATDINGDAKPDLAFTNYGIPGLPSTQDVSVAINTSAGAGDISFSKRVAFRVGSQPLGVSAADIDTDGKPDLVVGNNISANVSVLINETATGDAEPAFAQAVNFPAGGRPLGAETLATGDLNGDGKPDIVTPNFLSGHGMSVLLNQTPPGAATPEFAPQVKFNPGFGPQHIAIGDFDGDSTPDIAVALNQGLGVKAVPGVVIYPNHTSPGATTLTLARPVRLNAGIWPDALAEADYNDDGRLDLAVSNLATGTVTVILNETPAGIDTSHQASTP